MFDISVGLREFIKSVRARIIRVVRFHIEGCKLTCSWILETTYMWGFKHIPLRYKQQLESDFDSGRMCLWSD